MDNVVTNESGIIIEMVKKLFLMDKEIDAMLQDNPDKMDKWVDGEKLRKILGLSKRGLQNYRDEGIIPYSMIGGKIYYNLSDIEIIFRKNYFEAK